MEQVDFLLAPFNFQKLPKILIHDNKENYKKYDLDPDIYCRNIGEICARSN